MISASLVALGPVSMALYTPAMPQLVHAFSSTESAIKLTLSLYFAGFALSQLVSGTMSDVLGRRKTTLIFMTIYLAGSLMAHHDRHGPRTITIYRREIGVAQAGRADLDQDFARAGGIELNLLDAERAALGVGRRQPDFAQHCCHCLQVDLLSVLDE